MRVDFVLNRPLSVLPIRLFEFVLIEAGLRAEAECAVAHKHLSTAPNKSQDKGNLLVRVDFGLNRGVGKDLEAERANSLELWAIAREHSKSLSQRRVRPKDASLIGDLGYNACTNRTPTFTNRKA